MNNKYVHALAFVALVFLFSGCSTWRFGPVGNDTEQKKVVIQKVDREDIRQVMKEEKVLFSNANSERIFGATGEGIAPLNTISPAQALALAKRAAMADAYRQLGAKLFGVKINSQDTVRDAALLDSRITAQVNGLVKNATIINNSYENGLYKVMMELKISEDRWREVFSY